MQPVPVAVGVDAAPAPADDGELVPESERTLAVPPFLTKLFDILNDDQMRTYVRWCAAGDAFVITDPAGFAARVLPSYWRHNKLRSFVRSLKMYGASK